MPGVVAGVALAVAAAAVLVRGVLLVRSGRRAGRAAGATPEERAVAGLRVAAGIRMLNLGALLLVLAGVAAYVLR